MIFWMKIQKSAWFQYKNFLCSNFYLLDIFYIHAWGTCFSCSGNSCLWKEQELIFLQWWNKMNGRFTSSSSLSYESRTETPGHSLHQFNTHDHFGNLISFSGKSHILENSASLERGWIGSPSVTTIKLYTDKIFSSLNCSTDPLVNWFA